MKTEAGPHETRPTPTTLMKPISPRLAVMHSGWVTTPVPVRHAGWAPAPQGSREAPTPNAQR
jgi:hypothetical protein